MSVEVAINQLRAGAVVASRLIAQVADHLSKLHELNIPRPETRAEICDPSLRLVQLIQNQQCVRTLLARVLAEQPDLAWNSQLLLLGESPSLRIEFGGRL